MDEENKPQPKINTIFVILGFVGFAIFDLLSLIPGAGDVLDIPDSVVILVGAITGLGPAFILTEGVACGLKLLPVAQEFPEYTIAWIVVVFIDRKPSKLTAGIQKATEVVAAAEGDIEEGVEGATEEAEAVAQEGAEAEAGREAAERAEGEVSGPEGRRGSGGEEEEPEEGAEGGEGKEDNGPDEDLGEKKETMDELQDKLLEDSPEEEGENQEEDEEPAAGEESEETDAERAERQAWEKAQAVNRNLRNINPGEEIAA